MAVLFIGVAACTDDPMVKDYEHGRLNPDGSLTFGITVPGYALPTRATGDAEDIDAPITTLHLYLFDVKGGFIGIVEADKVDDAQKDTDLDPGEKDQVNDQDGNAETGEGTNATGYYKASIPQNTEVIHFVANAPEEYTPGHFDMHRYEGRYEEKIFLTMLTTQKVYWGTSTYSTLTTQPNPVVLYRNYAKVRYQQEEQTIITNTPYIHQINGWTLCNGSPNSLIAPYDAQVSTQHFHFSLTDNSVTALAHRYAAVPLYDQRQQLLPATPLSATGAASDGQEIYIDNQGKALSLFDHTVEAYNESQFLNSTSDARVFAIFHITTAVNDGSATSYEHKYYKILFLKNVEEGPSQTFDIKRNHIYTIRFEGINPDLGWDSFAEAVAGPPANVSEITVEESLPEVQSSNATLRVVNGTVRYIDDLTAQTGTTVDGHTCYPVNDLRIYYSGADGADEGDESEVLKVEWVSGQCSWTDSDADAYQPEKASLVCKKTEDPKGAYTHTISFDADAFSYGDNGEKHYKEGLIRITELLNDGVLSRYIRVYIGDPVSFRPLLISSDIPAMSDERITVAFTVPDSFYLPTALYPIEVRFGSDQVDVEKNLYTESMKVDLVSTAYDDNLLQYTHVVDGTTLDKWGWYANGQADDNWADWGYKYTYTIEEPADSGEHRVTLRTVYDGGSDFSVVMEGLSTVLLNGTGDVAEADIFNTRELKFNVLPQTTDATARRIMLDDGLYDTRLTTAYVNINTSDDDQSVSIPYTLGHFDTKTHEITQATLPTGGVNLWVYYRPDDLTPSGSWATLNNGKAFVDAEGNHFAQINRTTSPTGELTFTITEDDDKEVKNSLVFITARSETTPYGGSYNASAKLGDEDYVYTGVNDESNAWRSASALVSALSNWKFNPAPTEIADDNFEYADEMERNYGVGIYDTGHDFLVRIDRPSGTSGINLSVNTGGNLQLIEQVDVSEYNLDAGYYEEAKEPWDGVSTSVRRSKADDNGDIHLTLKPDQSPYCILRFRPLHYDHSGTITLADITGSGAIYDNTVKNTLKITHSPLTIVDHKYMWRDDYMLIGDTDSDGNADDAAVGDDQFYENLRVDENTAGQEFVARLYFPQGVMGRMSDKDDNDVDLTFSLQFSGSGAKVINPAGNGKSNNYTVDEESGKITVSKLVRFDGDLNGDGEKEAYVDIFLRTTESVTTENFRITSGDDLLFYRYVLGEFSTRTESVNGGGKVIYEISNDQTNWMTIAGGTDYFNTSNSILSSIYDDGQPFYLRVTLKNYVNKTWNPTATKDQRTDLTLKTSGFKVIEEYPTGSTYTRTPDDKNADGTVRHYQYRVYTYRLNNAQWASVSDDTDGTGRSIVVKLQTESTGLAEYLQLETRTDMSDEKTDWGAILDRTTILMGTQTTTANPGDWELWFADGKDINSNKAGTNNLIFDVNAQVNDKQTATSEDYYPIKLNNELNISFYAPFDGLDITVGVSQREGYANRNYAIYQVTPTGETALHSNTTSGTTLTEHTYTLGKAGLYRLRGTGSGDFYLYYIKLEKVKTEGFLGSMTWKAQTLGNNTLSNATWSGEITDASGDNNQSTLSLSAFAEKVTFTLDGITEDNTVTLRLLDEDGDGDEFLFLTPEGAGKVTDIQVKKGDTITVVPANGGQLMHNSIIKLDGEDAGQYYRQDITLEQRPYVKLTHNFVTEGQWTSKTINVGETVTITMTYDDNNVQTNQVQFYLGTGYDFHNWPKHYDLISPTNLTTSAYTLNTATGNAAQTFEWKATTAGNDALLLAWGTVDYDVYNTHYSIFQPTRDAEGNPIVGTTSTVYPKINITGVSITYDWGSHPDAEGILPENAVIGSGESYTLPSKNCTLYKERHTLTGWSDGTTTYAFGETFTPAGNVTLTPVFAENSVSLDDREAAVDIEWILSYAMCELNIGEGKTGIYVTQAVVNGETIDVKMNIDNTVVGSNGKQGKLYNVGRSDSWAQVNVNTKITIPSCLGAIVGLNAYSQITTTTINGEINYTADNTISSTVSDNDPTTDIIIGDGSYYSYVKVTLPVVEKEVNIIPTTNNNPFDLEKATLLYDSSNGEASAGGSQDPHYNTDHLDWMADGDYAEYEVNNTESAAYCISFNTATPQSGVTLTFTLFDKTGNQVWIGTSQTLTPNSSNDWTTQSTGQILTNYLVQGRYKLRITFNGGATTANLYSVSFTPIAYKVGLGTYASTVVYEDITVKNLDDGSTIYSSGTNISSSDWDTPTGLYGSGDNATYGSQLGLTDGADGATIVLNREVNTNNYELTCRAKKTSGSEGFLIMFDYADDQNRKWWNIGGWSNNVQTVETWVNNIHVNNYHSAGTKLVASGIWYNITIKVENGQFTGSCVPATIGAPYRLDCTFNGTTVNRTNTAVSQDANAVWALDGSIEDPSLTGGAFNSHSMTHSDFTTDKADETVNNVKTNYVTFSPSKANDYSPITWTISPTTGLTFTPTKVQAKILRVATDGGTVNVKVKNGDGKESTLATGIIPRRKGKNTISGDSNEDPKHKDGNTVYDYIEYEVDVSLATSNSFSFIIEVSIGSGKSVAISDVQIHGTVSGTME